MISVSHLAHPLLPLALGLVLVACGEEESAALPPVSTSPPRLPKAAPEPSDKHTQGLDGFFAPGPGETWTYLVHRDLPPDSLLSDDDQLRSSDLPGGGYRFTNQRRRVCLGTREVPGSTTPLTVFELSDNGIASGLEYLDIGPDGVVARGWQPAPAASPPDTLLEPGILLAAPDLEGGRSWESTGASPGQPIQFRVLERTKLTVPAGTYDTVRIQMNTGSDSRGVRRTLWFAEGVGIVQEETIHYDERRILVRELVRLESWSTPAADDREPDEPQAGGFPDFIPPPPDEPPAPLETPDRAPDEATPIVIPQPGPGGDGEPVPASPEG